MTVESNHAIALVLFLVGFLIGFKQLGVITLPIINMEGIGVGLTDR